MFSSIGTTISNYTRVIFAVLGLISLYPEVEISNVTVIEKNRAIYAEFTTKSLLNEYILQIIESGIDIYYNTEAVTYLVTGKGKREIYRNLIIKRISYKGDSYFLDNARYRSVNKLISHLNNNQILILPHNLVTRNATIRTTITLKIFSDAVPDLMNLWGNRPNIVLNYRTNEN